MVDACVLTDHEAAKILECPDLREPRHGARQPDGERRRSQRARPRVAEHARPGVIDLYTDTHPFNGPMSGTTQVNRYQKGKTNLDLTEARHSEWQWNPLGHMQVCTSLQTDNHVSTPPLRCPS